MYLVPVHLLYILHVIRSLKFICYKMRDEFEVWTEKGQDKNCLHNVYLSLSRPYKMNYLIYMVCLGLNLMNINHLENYIIIFTAAEGIHLNFVSISSTSSTSTLQLKNLSQSHSLTLYTKYF